MTIYKGVFYDSCRLSFTYQFSSDSESPMEDMIKKAISLGLKTICFTEHHDIDYPNNPDDFDFLLDLPSYKENLFTMKEQKRFGTV